MYYVGIDIAKLNHFASVVSSDGEVLVKPFKFTNDNDGFCTLLSALASYDRGSSGFQWKDAGAWHGRVDKCCR